MSAERIHPERFRWQRRLTLGVAACWAGMLACGACGCAEDNDQLVAEAPAPLLPLSESETPEVVDDLLVLMHQRLQIMDEVAKSKWNYREAIHDPEREQRLLDRMVGQSAGDPASIGISLAFFQAQIEAAKSVQQANFDRWHLEGQLPFSDVADTYAELRPEISRLSSEMQRLLSRLGPHLYCDRTCELIRQRAEVLLVGGQITPELRAQMIDPLLVRPPEAEWIPLPRNSYGPRY